MSRFPALRTIAYLLKGFAVLAVLIGGLVALTQDGAAMKIAFLAGALLYGVALWAFSELISVALSIESNTYLTQQAVTGGAPSGKSVPAISLPQTEPDWTQVVPTRNAKTPSSTPTFDRLP